MPLHGAAASPGEGCGEAWAPRPSPVTEAARLEQALAQVRDALDSAAAQTSTADASALVEVHAHLARDPVLLTPVRQAITAGESAEHALEHRASTIDSDALPGRAPPAEEARDVLWQIRSALPRPVVSPLPSGAIVLIGDPPPLPEVLRLHGTGRLVGLIGVGGSAGSHIGMLARELGIPAVLGVGTDAWRWVGRLLWVDGNQGQAGSPEGRQPRPSLPRLPEPPVPGLPVRAALSAPQSLEGGDLGGAEGIGLLRMDSLWRAAPAELDRHLHAAAIAAGPHGLTVRMYDRLPGTALRGVDLLKHHPCAFDRLLDSVCRLASGHPVRLLAPFLRSGDELAPWRHALRASAHRCGVAPPSLGAMLETPLTLLSPDALLTGADFVVIGTGDLCAALGGTHREDIDDEIRLAVQPVLLRLIAGVTQRAKQHDCAVEVAGPLARERVFVQHLPDLDIACVSVAPVDVGPVRRALAGRGA